VTMTVDTTTVEWVTVSYNRSVHTPTSLNLKGQLHRTSSRIIGFHLDSQITKDLILA
jgi:hypothetical protein